MTIGAILMMIFGIAVTWGGAGICLYIALKNKEND